MKKSKLITLLSTFSKEEIKRFEKFSSSGYYNQGRNFKPFLTILKNYYPLYDSPNLTSEKIYKKLYPGKEYDRNAALTMRVIESQLTSIAEKFIVCESLNEKDDFIFTKILSEKLMDRKLFSNAMNTGLKASEMLDNSERKIEYFDERLQMNELLATIFIKRRSGSKGYNFDEKNTLYLFAMFFDRLSKLSINLIGDSRVRNAPLPEIISVLNIVNNFDPELFEKENKDDDSGTREFGCKVIFS
jgi:hypothetical protein